MLGNMERICRIGKAVTEYYVVSYYLRINDTCLVICKCPVYLRLCDAQDYYKQNVPIQQRFVQLTASESLVLDSCFIIAYPFDCVDLLLLGETGAHWVVWEEKDD